MVLFFILVFVKWVFSSLGKDFDIKKPCTEKVKVNMEEIWLSWSLHTLKVL